jgi:TolB protein
MTLNDGFHRTISDWLDEQAGRGAPGYLDEILTRTARTRQRPAWSSLERWLPVQTTARFAAVPRVAWALALVLALILALGAAMLVIGSRTPHPLPAPFGLARNGLLVYGATDGDIYVLDPVTGRTTSLIADPATDGSPAYTRDGSRFSFLRDTDVPDRPVLMVANADGSNVRALTEPLIHFQASAWSADGSRAIVISDVAGSTAMRVVDVDGSASPRILAVGLAADSPSWRPNGRELVFRGLKDGRYGLYVVRSDGTDLRPITQTMPNDTDLMSPALSPDGTRLAYVRWETDHGVIHVVDVDSGVDGIPPFDGRPGDLTPAWSPDATRLVFERYFGGYYHLAVAPAVGGHVVEIGPAMLDGTNGAAFEFSPDGTQVVTRYAVDGSTMILDATGGAGQPVPAGLADAASWQRLAP